MTARGPDLKAARQGARFAIVAYWVSLVVLSGGILLVESSGLWIVAVGLPAIQLVAALFACVAVAAARLVDERAAMSAIWRLAKGTLILTLLMTAAVVYFLKGYLS